MGRVASVVMGGCARRAREAGPAQCPRGGSPSPPAISARIDELWALLFGNGASLGRSDHLYWTAGFRGEEDGGFGSLNFVVRPE